MTLRSLHTRAEKLRALLPAPDLCPGACTPLRIYEPGEPVPPPGPCKRCGKWPAPGSITCIVVVKPD
jgi:hypothetical protein